MVGCKPVDGEKNEKKPYSPRLYGAAEGKIPELGSKTYYDTPQPNPTGSCGVDKGKSETEMYIATYNTRTIRQQDDLERLLEELEEIKRHIIGLSENKKRRGLSELPGGHWIFEKGKTEDNPTANGVALLINRNMTKYEEKTNIYSERIIVCTIKTRGDQLQIIRVYVPTTIYDDEDVEIFYEELGKALDEDQSKYNIVMGDFNATIGKKDKHSHTKKLYEQTTSHQPTTLTSSPDKEEIPPFLEEEVKETLDEMKKKKGPGNDGITSDVMKIRGP
ncbi:endonuclease-reverse transcriptase [Plakobranchus ocellatus]|uniref:Endonuclease-reverse transcriptase n=1 Tax=Plakobranchus ocellatus TaxID=259542 RepID=A0AAV4AKQ8_9GAST|nr:endonuclease-reverse transcriptase [Plakobranchus ocellatus]